MVKNSGFVERMTDTVGSKSSRARLLLGAAGFSLLAFFAGCASPYKPVEQVLPQNIRKISIETFKNSTVYYGIEDKLTKQVTDEFIQDGRLEVTGSGAADGILRGSITRYVLEPLTYDENHVVREYKLRMLIDISLTDRVKNEVVWVEKNLEGTYRFFNVNLPGGITEEEAREVIWDKLARDILRRTIVGFGSVTGISEKKVPPKNE
jgi:hypothetical protein